MVSGCHRNPEKFVRPKEKIFICMAQENTTKEEIDDGRKWVRDFHIQPQSTDELFTCHR